MKEKVYSLIKHSETEWSMFDLDTNDCIGRLAQTDYGEGFKTWQINGNGNWHSIGKAIDHILELEQRKEEAKDAYI